MSRIRRIHQITSNPFLNYYELEAEKRTGESMPYYMASRAPSIEELKMNRPEKGPDGVAVFALWGEKKDRVVLVRQYRFPLGGYVYEFPSGLAEEGEDIRMAAVREFREETGMALELMECDPLFHRPFYMTVGMTDECCSMVYGTCSGRPSVNGLEDSEELEVILADADEVKRILRKEPVAVSCAYMLMQFLNCPEDPFSFLRFGKDM